MELGCADGMYADFPCSNRKRTARQEEAPCQVERTQQGGEEDKKEEPKMRIGLGRKSSKIGATGIVPCDSGYWVYEVSIIGAVTRLLVLLIKSKIASIRLNRKRREDRANYYFRRIEEIRFEITI